MTKAISDIVLITLLIYSFFAINLHLKEMSCNKKKTPIAFTNYNYF